MNIDVCFVVKNPPPPKTEFQFDVTVVSSDGSAQGIIIIYIYGKERRLEGGGGRGVRREGEAENTAFKYTLYVHHSFPQLKWTMWLLILHYLYYLFKNSV